MLYEVITVVIKRQRPEVFGREGGFGLGLGFFEVVVAEAHAGGAESACSAEFGQGYAVSISAYIAPAHIISVITSYSIHYTKLYDDTPTAFNNH